MLVKNTQVEQKSPQGGVLWRKRLEDTLILLNHHFKCNVQV
jgi:hypothetical protein